MIALRCKNSDFCSMRQMSLGYSSVGMSVRRGRRTAGKTMRLGWRLGCVCSLAELVGEFGSLVRPLVEQVGGLVFEVVHEAVGFLLHVFGFS